MKLNKLMAILLSFVILMPSCALAGENKSAGKNEITVNHAGKIVKEDGSTLNGFYNKVYYSNGKRDSRLNAVIKINGIEYYFRQGRSFTGVYGNRVYKNGLLCSYVTPDGKPEKKARRIAAPEISGGEGREKKPVFGGEFNLYTGPMSGFYYENGQIDFNFTGFKTSSGITCYVRAGKLYDGYFDGCFYKDGVADRDICGLLTVDGREYCFMAGYLYTGIYKNIYYENGLKSDFSGYKTIDNVRYYLNGGELANGVFDGAYFKAGLVDTSVNGRVEFDGEYYTFKNGITSDGLHDGKWYSGGKFDKNANGVKLYGGVPYYLENGLLSTGVAEYENALRYFKNGIISSYSGWLDIKDGRYYIENSAAVSGVKEIENKKYLFGADGKLCKNEEAVFENIVYTSDENGIASFAPQRYVSQRGSGIPYANSSNPDATISTSGCGVCSALMVILNETSNEVTLEDLTKRMLSYGCRASSGTDMRTTARLLEEDYGITCEITDSNEKLREHLKKGYVAVANVGKIPLFSLTGGHYVCVSGITKDGNAIILDPSAREGKYGSGTRKNIVYNSEKSEVYASFDTLRSDAKDDCYYLFTPTKDIALRKSGSSFDAVAGEADAKTEKE